MKMQLKMPVIPEGSIYNLKRIVLILGTACNFNCRYCVQHENKPRCKKTIHPDVIDWLKKVSYKLPQKLKPTIMFFGGEPLLYREAIHQVVDQLKDSFKYGITSNGSLLTEEDVEYFNENNIQFVLSHDGDCTEYTRQVDVLKCDKIADLFKKINNRLVSAVWTAMNSDMRAVKGVINAKLGENTPLTFEELMTAPETDPKLTQYNPNEILRIFHEMGESLDSDWDNTANHQQFCRMLREGMGRIRSPYAPRCACGFSEIGVDTQGNVYFCKNYNEKIGTINDPFEVLHERAKELLQKLYEQNLEKKGCLTCPVAFFCRGGCPFERPSERQKEKCEGVKAKWQAVIDFINNKLEIRNEDS